MSAEGVLELVRQLGVSAGLLLALFWLMVRREERLTTRLEKVEDLQRSLLCDLVANATGEIRLSRKVTEAVIAALEQVPGMAHEVERLRLLTAERRREHDKGRTP